VGHAMGCRQQEAREEYRAADGAALFKKRAKKVYGAAAAYTARNRKSNLHNGPKMHAQSSLELRFREELPLLKMRNVSL
jgi:hypothetical protein